LILEPDDVEAGTGFVPTDFADVTLVLKLDEVEAGVGFVPIMLDVRLAEAPVAIGLPLV